MKLAIKNLQIAIDGPSGSGKGAVAKILGETLLLPVLDTGLLYRFVAWQAAKQKVDLNDAGGVLSVMDDVLSVMEWRADGIFFSNRDCTSLLRGEDVGAFASQVAALPEVRDALLQLQQKIAMLGCVMDGRDIGTVVLPDAQAKFFLTASLRERARRRWTQLEGSEQQNQSFEETLQNLSARDQRDSERGHAPLTAADDAIVIDSTTMRIDEVVSSMIRLLQRRNLITDND